MRNPHSTQAHLIPLELQFTKEGKTIHTHLRTLVYVVQLTINILFLKKAISKFSLCYMKAKSLRQIIIPYPKFLLNIFVVVNKESMLLLCLRTSKIIIWGNLLGVL